MNLKDLVNNINSFETFVKDFIYNSMESQSLGLEFDFVLDSILENNIVTNQLAKDNILLSNVTGYDKVYLKEGDNGRDLVIMNNLSDNELEIAKEQIICYKKELAYINAINHKINIVRNLIKDNAF